VQIQQSAFGSLISLSPTGRDGDVIDRYAKGSAAKAPAGAFWVHLSPVRRRELGLRQRAQGSASGARRQGQNGMAAASLSPRSRAVETAGWAFDQACPQIDSAIETGPITQNGVTAANRWRRTFIEP